MLQGLKFWRNHRGVIKCGSGQNMGKMDGGAIESGKACKKRIKGVGRGFCTKSRGGSESSNKSFDCEPTYVTRNL